MSGQLIDLPVITRLDTDPDRVLSKALGQLTEVVVVGTDKDGQFYFAGSRASGPETLWMLEEARMRLVQIVIDAS